MKQTKGGIVLDADTIGPFGVTYEMNLAFRDPVQHPDY